MALFRCEVCNQPDLGEVQLTTNSMIDHLNDVHGIPVRDFTENTTLLRDTGSRDKNTGPRPVLNSGEQLVNEEWAP
jgi:hypothetical protein